MTHASSRTVRVIGSARTSEPRRRSAPVAHRHLRSGARPHPLGRDVSAHAAVQYSLDWPQSWQSRYTHRCLEGMLKSVFRSICWGVAWALVATWIPLFGGLLGGDAKAVGIALSTIVGSAAAAVLCRQCLIRLSQLAQLPILITLAGISLSSWRANDSVALVLTIATTVGVTHFFVGRYRRSAEYGTCLGAYFVGHWGIACLLALFADISGASPSFGYATILVLFSGWFWAGPIGVAGAPGRIETRQSKVSADSATVVARA
jgi:hypothetical protein